MMKVSVQKSGTNIEMTRLVRQAVAYCLTVLTLSQKGWKMSR